MSRLQPAPYQDAAGSLRWSEWYRQVNALLNGEVDTIGGLVDVVLTSIQDEDLLQWDAGSSTWINQAIAATFQPASDALTDLTNVGEVGGADKLLVSTGTGVWAYEAATTLPATIGGVIQDLDTLGAASANGEFVVATGAGAFAYETGTTARQSLGFDANTAVATTTATTTAYTHLIADRYILADTTSNAVTINLVAAATCGDGYRLDVKVINAANTTTIDASGGELIDGVTTKAYTTLYDHASLVCDGSAWHIV